MSWTQDYSVEGLLDLYEKLTNERLNVDELVKQKFREKSMVVTSEKLISLVDSAFERVNAKEIEIKFLDSRGFESHRKTYVPKLVKQITECGNYGLDIYEWKEVGDNRFKIEFENRDQLGEDISC